MKHFRAWPASRFGGMALAAFAAVLLLHCGGVGTGGTGGFVSSTITGFGSVIVGDVEFDDTNAIVLDDDGAVVQRSGNELRLGMTVDVDGSPIVAGASGKHSSASRVRISTAVQGPIDAVDAVHATLTVLGQQIEVNPATVFGPSLHGGLAGLGVGDVVAVFARPNAVSGVNQATRIEIAPSAKDYRLRGIVSATNNAQRTVRVGGVTLDYSNATGVPPDLAIGQLINVRLVAAPGTVLSVEAFSSAIPAPADGDTAEIEGQVTSFTSDSSFNVNGFAVDASRARLDVSSAPLGASAHVEVEGSIVGGTLVASNVKTFSSSEIDGRIYRVAGPITSLDSAGKTFALRNQVVDYASATFTNGSAANLAVGVVVHAQGPLSPDGTQIRASLVAIQ